MKSKRDHEILLYPPSSASGGYVTCELYEKWYELYVAQPEGGLVHVIPLEYAELEPFRDAEGRYFSDHCPNPRSVLKYAAHHGLEVHGLALELMVGRWRTEVLDDV